MKDKELIWDRFEELSNEVVRLYAALNMLSPMKQKIEECLDEKASSHVISMIEKAERFNP